MDGNESSDGHGFSGVADHGERVPGDNAVNGGKGRADEALPSVAASVDLRDLTAFSSYNDEHEPVLIVTDGEVVVELTGGLVGPSALAARGARRLAEAASAYAATVSNAMTSR